MMQFQFNGYKVFLAAALLLGNTVSALAEDAVNNAAQVEPSPAEAQTLPSPYEFNVTTIMKDKTHPHFGEGIAAGYAIDDEQGRTLTLVRGKTYTFHIDTGITHDFYFSTKPKGWGMDTLTKGVKGQFTYKGDVTFTPTAETPDVIYTACRNHKFMGSEIHIVNEEATGTEAQPQDATPPAEAKPSAGGY